MAETHGIFDQRRNLIDISHFKMTSAKTKPFFIFLFLLPFSFQQSREMYGVAEHNCALISHSLNSFKTRDSFSCARRCLLLDQCKSFNFAVSGAQQGLCELNSAGRDASKLLQYRPGFIFVEAVLKKPIRSCLDHWKQGARVSQIYHIFQDTDDSFQVFCDFGSEPGWIWTLIMSQSHANRNRTSFRSTPLFVNTPVKNDRPNWEAYRLSSRRMNYLKSQSTHWRVTCSFPARGVDYTDYARVRFTELDPFTFEGSKVCKKVEYLNVRGHNCTGCTGAWWQKSGMFLHHDSSLKLCEFGSTPGFVNSEDDFGYYYETNPAFRCSSSNKANTNHWLGRRV